MSSTDHHGRRLEWLVWAGLTLVTLTLLLAIFLAAVKYQRGHNHSLPVLANINDFSLTNQAGRAVSLGDLRGKVWVADIIFTRCAGPCPKMTRQMKAFQDALPRGSNVKLVTLTTDPEFDTPPILTAYAERFGTDTNRWMFLTGTKDEIAKLAVDSLKLTAVPVRPEDRQNPADLFIHSTIFVVVDKQARLRGVFETTGEGIHPEDVTAQILSVVKRLEREP